MAWLNNEDSFEANIMYQVAMKAVEMQRDIMYEDLARRIAANVSRLFKK